MRVRPVHREQLHGDFGVNSGSQGDTAGERGPVHRAKKVGTLTKFSDCWYS